MNAAGTVFLHVTRLLNILWNPIDNWQYRFPSNRLWKQMLTVTYLSIHPHENPEIVTSELCYAPNLIKLL